METPNGTVVEQENNDMDFSAALLAVKDGDKVARRGWDGKDMFIFLVDGSEFEVNRAPLDKIYPVGTKVTYRPHVDMRAADGTIGVWIASQTDMLADDWYTIEA